jgi:hypothetical protein
MNRRSFIRNSGLLATTVFISLKSYSANIFDRQKISGQISSKGKGIANVVISDGFSVVQTDKKGRYEIEVNSLAKFIWISTPSGYEFKADSYLSKHYKNLSETNELNFELKPLSQSDENHNFIIWADPQVKNKKDVQKMMENSVPDVQKIIQSINSVPVHGITVGDIVWDNHELFANYNEAVLQMGIPFFQVLGNHDMDFRLGGDDTSDATFSKNYGPTYFSFNRGKAHYVILDDVRYLGNEREYDGYITPVQLEWLKKDLKFVDKDSLLIICVHIPIHSQVKNNNDFYNVISDFTNVHIMSGHTHFNQNVVKDRVFEHNHGTVCGAWWTGPICRDGTPSGYAVYEVKGNNLKWYYQPTGSNKKNQLRIYIEEQANQKLLIANVWNWDPNWKIEYFLDGKSMGTMQQYTGYDPLSVQLYKGDKLPVGRSFAEPNETDHLFSTYFETSIKNIKVLVTDRFGEQYTAEI